MKVERAARTGFCFGVKRAISTLERVAGERGGVETLGAVVHNEQVLQRLAKIGVRTVKDVDGIKGKIVVTSSHGVSPQVEATIRARDIDIISTTCPFVQRAQAAARRLSEAGFFVVVFGDAEHREVKGILGWAQGKGMATTDAKAIARVERDRPFYETSKGGVTISGGEPMRQAEFTVAFLAGCHERGLHTALDTSGYSPWPILEGAVAHSDLVLYDIKHLDSATHRELTGVPNELILENLGKLFALKDRGDIVIRMPLVPGYNDQPENLHTMGRFQEKRQQEYQQLAIKLKQEYEKSLEAQRHARRAAETGIRLPDINDVIQR